MSLPSASITAVDFSIFTVKPSWRFATVMAALLRLLAAVAVLLHSFPGPACGHPEVLELGDADFDYLAKEQETMLVKFYAPW